MASSGSFNTSGYQGRYIQFSWNIQSQDVANNRTVIAWTLKGAGTASSSYYYAGSITLTVNGTSYSYWSDRQKLYDGTVIGSGTTTIYHNADGTKSFSASCSASIYTYAVDKTGSGSWSLTTIPRASTPSLPNPSTMGTTVTINTNRASSSFTHDLEVTFGGTTTTLATGVGASYSWAIPDWSSRAQNALSGPATLKCITYNGSTNIGEKTVDFTLNIPAPSTLTANKSTASILEAVTISIARNSTNFVDDIQYQVNGGTWYTIAQDVSANTYSWAIPTDILSKAADSSTCTITLRAITKNGTATQASTSNPTISVNMPAATTPVLSQNTVDLQQPLLITLSANASQYTHNVYYTKDGTDTQIAAGVTGSYTWTPPASIADSVTNAQTKAVSIKVVTKNGTATIGTKTAALTLNIPNTAEFLPTISMALAPYEELITGYYVMGHAKVRGTFTGTAQHSATITSYVMRVENANYTASSGVATSTVLKSYGALTVTGTVTDSRGKTVTVTDTIEVVEYSAPYLGRYGTETGVVVTRGKQNGTQDIFGEYLVIKATRVYSPMITSGTQNNFCKVEYRYRAVTDQNFSAWIVLLAKSYTTDNDINVALASIVPNTKMDYVVQIRLMDDYEYSTDLTAVTRSYNIPAASTPLHLGENGKGLGLGQFSTSQSEQIDVGWDITFNGTVIPHTVWGNGTSTATTGVLAGADATLMEHTLYLAVFSTGKRLVLVMGGSGKITPVNYEGSPSISVSGTTLQIRTNKFELTFTSGTETLSITTNTTNDSLKYLYSLI